MCKCSSCFLFPVGPLQSNSGDCVALTAEGEVSSYVITCPSVTAAVYTSLDQSCTGQPMFNIIQDVCSSYTLGSVTGAMMASCDQGAAVLSVFSAQNCSDQPTDELVLNSTSTCQAAAVSGINIAFSMNCASDVVLSSSGAPGGPVVSMALLIGIAIVAIVSAYPVGAVGA